MKTSTFTPAAIAVIGTLLPASPVFAEETQSTTPAQADEQQQADEPARLEAVQVTGVAQPDTLNLSGPVATGSNLDIPSRDLPASVSVIDQGTMQQRGARTAMEAVESTVGMIGGTGVGSIPGYSTRGFTSNDITILRDGVRQNTNSQSARPLDSFMFERIEVLKGPASLLYGEGAVGGAINYVSKLPSETFEGKALISAGSWDSYRAAIGMGGPSGVEGLSYRVDISRNEKGGYVHGSSEEYNAYGGSLMWVANEDLRFTLSGSYFEDDVQSYYGTPVVYDGIIDETGRFVVAPADTKTDTLVNARIEDGTRRTNYNNLDNFARAENGFGRFITDLNFTDAWSLRNELYLATQKLDWRNTEKAVWNPVTELVDRSSFFLIYRDDTQVGNRLDFRWNGLLFGLNSQFVLGTLYDHNAQNRNNGQDYPDSPLPASVSLYNPNRGFGPPADTDRTTKIITETTAFYLENITDVTTQWKLVTGLRYDAIEVERISYVGEDRYTKTYYPLTGRIGAVYAVNPEFNLYASYSQAAQPVSQLVSLSASNDEFSLQKGEQIEVGAKATLLDNRLDMTMALYDIEKNDILTTSVIDGERINSQIGAQVSQGAELASAFRFPDNWTLHTNLAWNWKAEYEEFNENLGSGIVSRAGNTPPNVPEWVASLYLNKIIGRWDFFTGVRYVSERETNTHNGIQLAAYTTVDASISYLWQRYTVTLRGRNLTDEVYASWASNSGLTQRLDDPRSVELGVHYRFGD